MKQDFDSINEDILVEGFSATIMNTADLLEKIAFLMRQTLLETLCKEKDNLFSEKEESSFCDLCFTPWEELISGCSLILPDLFKAEKEKQKKERKKEEKQEKTKEPKEDKNPKKQGQKADTNSSLLYDKNLNTLAAAAIGKSVSEIRKTKKTWQRPDPNIPLLYNQSFKVFKFNQKKWDKDSFVNLIKFCGKDHKLYKRLGNAKNKSEHLFKDAFKKIGDDKKSSLLINPYQFRRVYLLFNGQFN